MSGLGYLGADIVVGADNKPVLLELNARPGLAIQVANSAGLLPRLKRVDQSSHELLAKSAAERAQLSQQWFGAANGSSTA